LAIIFVYLLEHFEFSVFCHLLLVQQKHISGYRVSWRSAGICFVFVLFSMQM